MHGRVSSPAHPVSHAAASSHMSCSVPTAAGQLPAPMQVVSYTGKGRAVNDNEQSLASTSNAAFLSLVYAKYARSVGQYNQLQKRYVCWSRGQMRYLLGDAGRSLVVGQGSNPPLRVQNEAASCSPSPSTCTRVRPCPVYDPIVVGQCCGRMGIIPLPAWACPAAWPHAGAALKHVAEQRC